MPRGNRRNHVVRKTDNIYEDLEWPTAYAVSFFYHVASTEFFSDSASG